MSLLVDMMRDAQDPSYAAVARQQPAAREQPAAVTRRRARGLLLLLLVGLATGTAAAGVRAGADDAAATRTDLVTEVSRRTAESDSLAADADRLRTEVDSRRRAALDRDTAGRAQARQLAAAELASGAVAVTGPGIVVTLDDRPEDAGPVAGLGRGGQLADGRVQDRDLQELVNGLWDGGAEAVTVNGLRLTARTAIRSAGEAILVDFRPLSPPYVVQAIGDPSRLEPDFADSASARRLASYAEANGLPLSVQAQDRLELAAGTVSDLVAAAPEGP